MRRASLKLYPYSNLGLKRTPSREDVGLNEPLVCGLRGVAQGGELVFHHVEVNDGSECGGQLFRGLFAYPISLAELECGNKSGGRIGVRPA